ncbi:MAG: hypothetical protein L3J39_06225 [Verrucomicrobiales bacterium]|nr:hypothetical protein [Verrucomicrobiales bacterium]
MDEIINTNNSGQAQVWLTLGTQAGLANNLIRAYNPTMAEDVYFTATTQTGAAAKAQIEGASGTQYAQTNSQPVEALTVVVSDENHNPLANTPVIFTITGGDAHFKTNSSIGGQLQSDQIIETITDNKGQASTRPYIGTNPSNIVITAQTQTQDPTSNTLIGTARFNIIALQRQDGPTQLTGVVMDHIGIPLAGITFSIGRTNLTAISDDNGYFEFPSQVPTGKIDLFVDGRDVQVVQNGALIEYPALHFETAIIQGQTNQLPHPIYLPPVHLENASTVGGNTDVTLTIPNFEGFKMIVKAGSVTFPDGSTEGELVVSPVHNDRLPMVPPGTAGRFMATGWTIQPTGTRFDPPIEVHIPNVDGLNPGTIVPIVQWDHDMAFFVPMGLGTISEDGSTLVTNPNSGITKAGWGGGPPPIPPNDAECENGMNKSTGQSCGCEVVLKADGEEDELWKLFENEGTEVSFVAKLSEGCGQGQATSKWTFEGLQDSNLRPLITTHDFSTFGTYFVKVEVFCDNCNPGVSDVIKVEIFLPVVEIKEDEEHENGSFELIGINNDQYYAERTNLIIDVKYPSSHPEKAGKTIEDYSGKIKIKEDSATEYYNGEDEASKLPKNVNISKGIGAISMDSVSNIVGEPNNVDDVPEKAKINFEFEGLPSLENDSTKDFEVEQWVKDSDLEVSNNLGQTNDPQMPDWLEKQSWDSVDKYKLQGGLVGQTAGFVKRINMFYKDSNDINSLGPIVLSCGVTPFTLQSGFTNYPPDGGSIFMSPFCNLKHRKNTNLELSETIIHEARHLIQYLLLTNSSFPVTDNGFPNAPFINDSDGDTCLEFVPTGVEAAKIDDPTSPIQEGVSIVTEV